MTRRSAQENFTEFCRRESSKIYRQISIVRSFYALWLNGAYTGNLLLSWITHKTIKTRKATEVLFYEFLTLVRWKWVVISALRWHNCEGYWVGEWLGPIAILESIEKRRFRSCREAWFLSHPSWSLVMNDWDTVNDCGVWAWPWRWFVPWKADRQGTDEF